MKYFLIFNPGARNGQSEKLISRIHGLLNDRKVNYEYGITKSLQDAILLSQKANSANYDAVVAVGGDGTINKVLNGFYDDNGLRASKARFGVIYTGTSPDFCKSYRIPYANIDRSIDVLLAGNTTNIQIGKIIFASKISQELDRKPVISGSNFITRYFSCCTNIGLGAAVARYANSGVRKLVGDNLGTFSALIKAFVSFHPVELSISINGQEERLSRLYNLSIGKTFHIASGIKVKNRLVEGDDSFYALIVRNVDWTKVPYCLKSIYSGQEILNSDIVCLKYAKNIEIYGHNSAFEVEFDGDPQGFLPCRIEMAKDKLELINEAG
ncbi:MAG: diacylglycerol kinase [Candidatus Omnitrophica bacterium]|nr:diacylglycerol kinase [Candidatus Omnitrophota bacterium]MBU4467661.1 diacylglycerol kinase [Candidatus Omnitrophota bacterium]MCG2707485.1 diacylglycerol kinase [Candidatus Omnitrophota bacterium]